MCNEYLYYFWTTVACVSRHTIKCTVNATENARDSETPKIYISRYESTVRINTAVREEP